MDIKKVEYLGFLLTDTSVSKLLEFLSSHGLHLIGTPQKNMHYTLHYYGWKSDVDRSDIPVADLGRTVELTLDSFGCYIANGIVQNMGFRISLDCLNQIVINNRPLAELSCNDVPHITVALNPAVDKEGKKIAKAANTSNCDFSKPLDVPLVVEATLAVFRGDKVEFQA